MQFSASFVASKTVKKMHTVLNRLSLSVGDLENVDVAWFSNEIQKLKLASDRKIRKDKTGELKASELEELSLIYERAKDSFFSKPYLYRSTVVETGKTLFVYGLAGISNDEASYAFNKYGSPVRTAERAEALGSSSYKDLYMAAVLGDAKAQYDLGMAYLEGQGIPIDYIEANKWLSRSARQDNMNALYQLYLVYKKGIGVPKNKATAESYKKRAADLGHQKAQEK